HPLHHHDRAGRLHPRSLDEPGGETIQNRLESIYDLQLTIYCSAPSSGARGRSWSIRGSSVRAIDRTILRPEANHQSQIVRRKSEWLSSNSKMSRRVLAQAMRAATC